MIEAHFASNQPMIYFTLDWQLAASQSGKPGSIAIRIRHV